MQDGLINHQAGRNMKLEDMTTLQTMDHSCAWAVDDIVCHFVWHCNLDGSRDTWLVANKEYKYIEEMKNQDVTIGRSE